MRKPSSFFGKRLFLAVFIVTFSFLAFSFGFPGKKKSNDAVEKIDLEKALSGSKTTLAYVESALDYGTESYRTLLPLMANEYREKVRKLFASYDEVKKNREGKDLDKKTIKGACAIGKEMSSLKITTDQEKEKTKKLVRKAYFLSGLVLAMNAEASISADKDIHNLKAGITSEKPKGIRGLKTMLGGSGKGQIKKAKITISVLTAFVRSLPSQKDNFLAVRKACKQIAQDQGFTLPADPKPEDVKDPAKVKELAEEDID